MPKQRSKCAKIASDAGKAARKAISAEQNSAELKCRVKVRAKNAETKQRAAERTKKEMKRRVNHFRGELLLGD
jgi:hypothetical protein